MVVGREITQTSHFNTAIGDSTQEYSTGCQELAPLIYHSYIANELICLYAEISLWHAGISMDVFNSFHAYKARIIRTMDPLADGTPDVSLFHSKIDIIASKVLNAAQVRWNLTMLTVGMVYLVRSCRKPHQNCRVIGLFGILRPYPNPSGAHRASNCLLPAHVVLYLFRQ